MEGVADGLSGARIIRACERLESPTLRLVQAVRDPGFQRP